MTRIKLELSPPPGRVPRSVGGAALHGQLLVN